MKQQNIIALGLSLALIAGLTAPAVAADGDLFPATEAMPAFTDVVESGSLGAVWYDYGSVKVCVEAGLMKGTGAGFNPGGTLSVAEVATVAARIHEKLSGSPMPEQGDPWYQGAIQVMEELGLLMPDDPTVPASRADFVEILSAVLSSGMLEPINSITTLPDTDDSDVLAFYNAGIITGSDKYGTFTGDRGLSRAEAAAMLSRIVRPSLRKTFTLEAKAPAGGGLDSLTQLLLGMGPDETIATVDGKAVPAKEFLYFLNNSIDRLGKSFGSTDYIDWEMELSGTPVSDYLKTDALDTATLYAVVEAEAGRAGVTLTAEDVAELDGYHAYAVEALGSEEAFQRYLQRHCIDEAGLRHLQSISCLYANLEQHLFPTPDEKELAAYVEETGTMKAKHILVGDKALAEDILSQLKAAGNSEAKFDALAEEYSEDGRNGDGTLASPDGYVFTDGEMVQEFEDGVKALEPGQISGLVESQYGYHIILRLSVLAEDTFLDGNSVRDRWASDRMDALLSPKIEQAKVETTALYDGLDAHAFWETLNALMGM